MNFKKSNVVTTYSYVNQAVACVSVSTEKRIQRAWNPSGNSYFPNVASK